MVDAHQLDHETERGPAFLQAVQEVVQAEPAGAGTDHRHGAERQCFIALRHGIDFPERGPSGHDLSGRFLESFGRINLRPEIYRIGARLDLEVECESDLSPLDVRTNPAVTSDAFHDLDPTEPCRI